MYARSPSPRAPGITANTATTDHRKAIATLTLLIEGLQHLLPPSPERRFARAVWSAAAARAEENKVCAAKGLTITLPHSCEAGFEGAVADGKWYLWGDLLYYLYQTNPTLC